MRIGQGLVGLTVNAHSAKQEGVPGSSLIHGLSLLRPQLLGTGLLLGVSIEK